MILVGLGKMQTFLKGCFLKHWVLMHLSKIPNLFSRGIKGREGGFSRGWKFPIHNNLERRTLFSGQREDEMKSWVRGEQDTCSIEGSQEMLIHDIINHCHYFYYKYWWGHVASNNGAVSHCPDSFYSGRMSSVPSCQEYQLPWLMAESCGSDAQGYTLSRRSWMQWPVHVNTQGSSFPISDGTVFQIFFYTGWGFSCSCSTSGVVAALNSLLCPPGSLTPSRRSSSGDPLKILVTFQNLGLLKAGNPAVILLHILAFISEEKQMLRPN